MDLCPFSVTPAASLLARCVSRGAVTQEQIDSISSSQGPVFSSHLQEAEQRIRAQRQLDEMRLQVELLQVEKQSADVTHKFYLSFAGVVWSPAGRPEAAEQSETETDEAAGSHQPARPGSPAQVCGGRREDAAGLH